MLRLFQSIFGTSHDNTPYPDELIKRGIERAVDVIDPRLRAVPGYQKKLCAAVIHAIDYVVDLVDSLPTPVQLNQDSFANDPELMAYFASAAHAQEILSLNPALNQWLKSPDNVAENIIMLLLMELHEHNSFGMALEGDMLRRDVAQTTVNFSHHQLVDPSAVEEDTRRLLKHRAFDHLLELVLKRIATMHSHRAELEREYSLLQRKCTALEAGCWGFGKANGDSLTDPKALQQQLQAIESQLMALGGGTGLLNTNLEIIVDMLTQAEQNIWIAQSPLTINRMHVKQSQVSAEAPEINLTVLHNINGRSLVARLVSIAYGDLPPRRDFFVEAKRYLG